MTKAYPQIQAKRKDGSEKFFHENDESPLDILGFWRWACSDLLSNATRGILAEYIVAGSLGIHHGVRTEWEPYDLETQNGLKIEVKTSGYLQSWGQKRLSDISFNIKPALKWEGKTGQYSEEAQRQSDIYVFCVLAHKVPETVNPLNLDQWEFYVLPTRELDSHVPNQKNIGLSGLLKLKPQKARYSELSGIIHKAERRQLFP